MTYKAGKTNVNADALSRNPVDNIKENENKTITAESKNNNDSKYFIKENDKEENYETKTRSTKSTNPTKSTNFKKHTNPFYLIQTYINDKNSDGEPEPPVATNSSKFEEKQSSNQNSSSDDETENLVYLIYIIRIEAKTKYQT